MAASTASRSGEIAGAQFLQDNLKTQELLHAQRHQEQNAASATTISKARLSK